MTMKEQVSEALYDVYDPELGINIVDLGLVYGIDVDDKNNVLITMTLTTPGCPMHDSISTGIKNRIRYIEDAGHVEVKVVWEPAWNPDKMSDTAKERLWG
jgi:metal-sulfur cluster biosynthetic enzyme